MHVVIFGAGTVGTSIARVLCEDRHNVTLIDESPQALMLVEERLDVQTVRGSACNAVTLFQSGAQMADLCLAVTNRDEVNLISASLAKAMGAVRAVARTMSPSLLDASTFDYRRHFQIDRLLSLEHLTAVELAKSIRTRGMFAVESFARGGVEVGEFLLDDDSKAVGTSVRDLDLPAGVLIGLIAREDRAFIAGADDVLASGDHVTLIGKPEELKSAAALFEKKRLPRLNVIIAGGGEIGLNLALVLEGQRYKVVLMEADQTRCEYLAEKLESTTVLHADATRQSEMEEARVGNADIFVTTMGRDEDNIICGVEAREYGARRIYSVVRRPDYANVLKKLGIDVAVSPREVMARQIVGMLQHGPILSRSEIGGGDAEVWEIDVTPDTPATQAPLKDLNLKQCIIAAIVRDEYTRVPGAEDAMRAGDTVVVIVQKESAQEMVKLFERMH
jgi:trk system potassium uptake protein TrkA